MVEPTWNPDVVFKTRMDEQEDYEEQEDHDDHENEEK
jgi:hypothetical protein